MAQSSPDPRERRFASAQAGFAVDRGTPEPFGASLVRGGANFAIFSRHATAVSLVLFAPGEHAPVTEIPLDPRFHRTGDVWHAKVSGVDAGLEYGFRIDGPRTAVNRFDPGLVLLDPYARALSGAEEWGAPVRMRRSAIPDSDFDWELDRPLDIPLADTVIYELHVRGFTRDASSGVQHPGTFDGLIEKIPYLTSLGITAVELMPVTEFDELDRPGTVDPISGAPLFNAWGYHPLALFAPKTSYAADRSKGGAVREFKRLVRAMHGAGIEVILDLVFNHTGEGGPDGPTSSFRGIDNAVYYISDPVTGVYRDYTGCGNTVNCNHPVVRDLILQCLRYWVTEMHVDGFRFDLASVLGRGRDGTVLSDPPLLERIAHDPVLARTKLIAEAWDAGLYQVGSFHTSGRWGEWNGRFRDDVRRFVKGDGGLAAALATRLAGSPDLYRSHGRSAHHSVNFVTSHDGFTLADLASYNRKHNDGNGEGSRDGANENDSWNCGWEGAGAPADVERLRRKQARNMLAILFLSQGIPMLLAGDERGRTQGGNNNAYCHDSPVSWVNWTLRQEDADLLRFVTLLIAFRCAHRRLTMADFLDGDTPVARGEWHGLDPGSPDWSRDSRLVVARIPAGNGDSDVLVAANAHWTSQSIALPSAGAGRAWRRRIDTSLESPHDIAESAEAAPVVSSPRYVIEPRSVVVLEA